MALPGFEVGKIKEDMALQIQLKNVLKRKKPRDMNPRTPLKPGGPASALETAHGTQPVHVVDSLDHIRYDRLPMQTSAHHEVIIRD